MLNFRIEVGLLILRLAVIGRYFYEMTVSLIALLRTAFNKGVMNDLHAYPSLNTSSIILVSNYKEPKIHCYDGEL